MNKWLRLVHLLQLAVFVFMALAFWGDAEAVAQTGVDRAGTPRTPVRFVVTELCQVPSDFYGKIVTENGGLFLNLPNTISIVASSPGQPTLRAMVQKNGDFRFIFSQRGEYRLSLSLPYGYEVKSMVDGSTDLMRETLQFAPCAVTNIQIKMIAPPLQKIRGRVVEEGTNKVMDRATIDLVLSPGDRKTSISTTDGFFEFAGPSPGEYDLRVSSPYHFAAQQKLLVTNGDLELQIALPPAVWP